MVHIGDIYAQTANSKKYLVLDSDNVDISGSLIVKRDASFNGDADISEDLTVLGTASFDNTIIGSINGNAATVTTNANLIGDITSIVMFRKRVS